MIEHDVDYFQCSLLRPEKWDRALNHKEISGFGFYDRGYECPLGRRYYYGNVNSKKCFHVASGRAINNMQAVGYSVIEHINQQLALGATFSRVDLCITEYVEDNLVTVDDVENWYHEKQIISSLVKYGAKKIVAIEENYNQATETLYIGDMKKRAKKGIFRAYDKGVELDLGKFMVTRLEYEDRGDKAHMTARRLAQGYDIGSVFKTRFDVENEEFYRICNSENIDTTRGKQLDVGDDILKNESRWTWLLNQVAPALRLAIESDEKYGLGNERMKRFLDKALIKYKED